MSQLERKVPRPKEDPIQPFHRADVGRVAHAYGVSQAPQIMPLRAVGIVGTFAATIIGAIANLVAALAG